MYRMTPRHLSCILAPHFHGPSAKRTVLVRDRDESFSRWGLPTSDHVHHSNRVWYHYSHERYFESDIVDAELHSASCYLSKWGWSVKERLGLITSRVMNEPGLTWLDGTKEYVEKSFLVMQCRPRELSERVLMMGEDKSFRTDAGQGRCRCGNLAAALVSGECGNCCEGPCVRHGTM